MTRFASIAVAAATLLSAAAPALAAETPGAREASGRINVALCERDAMTQASFRRNHGPSPVFVTADQVLSARASGERWTQPRCMTAGEHQRLRQALAPRLTRSAGGLRTVL